MRISDWSSDVCSSDLAPSLQERLQPLLQGAGRYDFHQLPGGGAQRRHALRGESRLGSEYVATFELFDLPVASVQPFHLGGVHRERRPGLLVRRIFQRDERSEEHTSELQSLMRISYAVFCLKKKKTITYHIDHK